MKAGYCTGLMEALVAFNSCIPNKVTRGQTSQIVIKYLREHPERLHEQAVWLAAKALDTAFPCAKK